MLVIYKTKIASLEDGLPVEVWMIHGCALLVYHEKIIVPTNARMVTNATTSPATQSNQRI